MDDNTKSRQPSSVKPVFSISVSEYTSGDNVDHAVEARIVSGGLQLNFNTTVDKIRKFFTERRERADKKANLKSVP
jgi:hypothetical protein